MNDLENEALALLQKDPVAMAEELLGRDNVAVPGMSLLLVQQLSRQKEDVLSVLGDTHFKMAYAECVRLLERAEFEKVYTETHGDLADVFEIWWHSDGLLLTSESYNQQWLNSCQVYYNWRTADRCRGYEFTTSGGWYPVTASSDELIWSGYYDGREGLLTHLKRLRENGQLLSTWVRQPFTWLLNYTENRTKGDQYKAVNRLKYEAFPEHMKQAIGDLT